MKTSTIILFGIVGICIGSAPQVCNEPEYQLEDWEYQGLGSWDGDDYFGNWKYDSLSNWEDGILGVSSQISYTVQKKDKVLTFPPDCIVYPELNATKQLNRDWYPKELSHSTKLVSYVQFYKVYYMSSGADSSMIKRRFIDWDLVES